MKNTNNETPAAVAEALAMPMALPTNSAPQHPAAAEEDAPLPPQEEGELPEMPESLMQEDGSFLPDWYSRFAELQPYAATLAKFRRPEALAKSYAHLERMKGYPDADDAERMAAFRMAVGLPEKAEDYVLKRPEDSPEGTWDDGLAAALAKVAYEQAVPARAMEAMSRCYSDACKRHLQEQQLAEAAELQAADEALQEDWGSRYEENMRIVGDYLLHMGQRSGVNVQSLVESPALRANADFARLMLASAELMREAPLHRGSPEEHADEARRIALDPNHPLHEAYMRSNHPQHRFANEQYDRLAFGRRL